MGIKERKSKHKEDIRQRILDAAKKLFLQEGYEATSIRKIAAEIEFSPTTIYLYYTDKAAIAYALQQEGFRLMRQRFDALGMVDEPFERLKAMGRVYLQFAIENPDFYELMFIMKEPMEFLKGLDESEREWENGLATFNYLVQTTVDCQRAGYFLGQDERILSFLIWSTVHGICALSLHGHLDQICTTKLLNEDANKVIDRALESFIALLGKVKG